MYISKSTNPKEGTSVVISSPLKHNQNVQNTKRSSRKDTLLAAFGSRVSSSTGLARKLDVKNQWWGGGPGWRRTLDARSLVERHWSLKRPGARLCWGHSFLKKALSRKCSTPLSQPAFAPFSQGPHQSQWVRLEPGRGGAGLKGSSEEWELFLSFFFFFLHMHFYMGTHPVCL